MPTYEYEARERDKSCEVCRDGFELTQTLTEEPLNSCPHCGSPVRKVVSLAAVGRSMSGLDDRAKAAGFKKLKKIGTGEYEQQY